MKGTVLKACKNACANVQKGINAVLIVLLIVMSVLMFSQVVLRSGFGSSLTWAEELLRFMFIWLVFLGLPTGVYYSELTRFDLLETTLKGVPKKLLETGIYLLINAILFILVWGSFTLIQRQFNQQATTLPIPMGVVYLILPISSIIAIVFAVIKLILMWVADSDFEAGGN